jgi:hypothetical protein
MMFWKRQNGYQQTLVNHRISLMMTSKQKLNAKLAIMGTLQKSSSEEIGKYQNSSQKLIKEDEYTKALF